MESTKIKEREAAETPTLHTSEMNRAFLALAAVQLLSASAFYLPGVAPYSYDDSEEVELKVLCNTQMFVTSYCLPLRIAYTLNAVG